MPLLWAWLRYPVSQRHTAQRDDNICSTSDDISPVCIVSWRLGGKRRLCYHVHRQEANRQRRRKVRFVTTPTVIKRVCCRFLFDDGTGEGHVYADTQHLASLLTCTAAEWSTLTRHAEREGRIVYTRYIYNGRVGVSTSLLCDSLI